MHTVPQRVQRVMVLTSAASSFGRRVLKGVSTYVRPTRNWVMQIGTVAQLQLATRMQQFKPTGIIAHVGSQEMVDVLQQWNVPVVNVSNALPDNPLPRVSIDDAAVGELAARHLLEKGLEHFAFCGDLSRGYARARRDGFANLIKAQSCSFAEFAWSADDAHLTHLTGDYLTTGVEQALRAWLEQLPRPVGILVYQDYMGLVLSEVCRQMGLPIPEAVALVGVDDDELACQFAYPPMSSVRSPLEMVGYEAARVLDELLQGGSPPAEPILFSPSAVTVRQSTDLTACEDEDLARALRFIRLHADRPIGVEDILNEVLISRRTLESKFKQQLGRSPLAEIHRVHVEQACRLLTETQLPMPRVASSSGFTSSAQMGTVFHKYVGMTPSDYRRRPAKPRGEA